MSLVENKYMNEKTVNTKTQVIEVLKEYLSSDAFVVRKLTDTPTDKNQVVPRGYVTRSFTTATRPTTSVLGEFYFDLDQNLPCWWNGSAYTDAAGNVIS